MLLTVVLEKTLESPLDSKEIKPINPKANQPWILLEGLMLKLQYFGYLMWRVNSLEKTLMLGKIEGRKRSKWQIATPTQKTWIWAKSGRQWRTEEPGVLQSMGLPRVGHDWTTKQQQKQLQPFCYMFAFLESQIPWNPSHRQFQYHMRTA